MLNEITFEYRIFSHTTMLFNTLATRNQFLDTVLTKIILHCMENIKILKSHGKTLFNRTKPEPFNRLFIVVEC